MYYWLAYNKQTGEIKMFDTDEQRDVLVNAYPETWEKAGQVHMQHESD